MELDPADLALSSMDPIDLTLYSRRKCERKTIENLSGGGEILAMLPPDHTYVRLRVLKLYDLSELSRKTHRKLLCAWWVLVENIYVKHLKHEEVAMVIPTIQQADITGIALIKNLEVVGWFNSLMVDEMTVDELAEKIKAQNVI